MILGGHGSLSLELTSAEIQNCGRRPNCKWLNRYSSAADFPILLKFGM